MGNGRGRVWNSIRIFVHPSVKRRLLPFAPESLFCNRVSGQRTSSDRQKLYQKPTFPKKTSKNLARKLAGRDITDWLILWIQSRRIPGSFSREKVTHRYTKYNNVGWNFACVVNYYNYRRSISKVHIATSFEMHFQFMPHTILMGK